MMKRIKQGQEKNEIREKRKKNVGSSLKVGLAKKEASALNLLPPFWCQHEL